MKKRGERLRRSRDSARCGECASVGVTEGPRESYSSFSASRIVFIDLNRIRIKALGDSVKSIPNDIKLHHYFPDRSFLLKI